MATRTLDRDALGVLRDKDLDWTCYSGFPPLRGTLACILRESGVGGFRDDADGFKTRMGETYFFLGDPW